MDSLVTLLHGTLYWLSPAGRAVLKALVMSGGVYGTASLFAVRVGFRDRHHLARGLVREGLPPLEELAGWVRIATWVLDWEEHGTSLHRLALEAHLDPTICYRTVRRLTRANWGQLRERGVAWVLERLQVAANVPIPQM